MDVKGGEVAGLKRQQIRRLYIFGVANQNVEFVNFLLRGNISKQALNPLTERFRCQYLAIGLYT